MAKKIQAYIDGAVIDPPDQHTKLIASVVAAPFFDANPVRCVTLVDHHSDKHERVFTESEVKAMMEDVAHCITWPEAKRVLKSKHGLLLDPA
jgi:hypothetical protein